MTGADDPRRVWAAAVAGAAAMFAVQPPLDLWWLAWFAVGMPGHTQWRWTTLLQAADTIGEVGVGGIVMGVAAAAAVAAGLDRRGRRTAVAQVAVAVAVLATAVAYGHWRLRTAPTPAGRPLDVLLVQGSMG